MSDVRKKCPNCKGSGDLKVRSLLTKPEEIGEIEGKKIVAHFHTTRITECALCTGTGLVENDQED